MSTEFTKTVYDVSLTEHPSLRSRILLLTIEGNFGIVNLFLKTKDIDEL